jgi:formylglycine-generating enzyme required for sulfatase activity
MGVVERRKPLNWKIIGIAALLVLLGGFTLFSHFRAYLRAPGTYDLTGEQRKAALKSALRGGGISALRETGGMRPLHREDIAHVGKSRCVGEHECVRTVQRRRALIPECAEVHTNLYCAYEILDTQGNTAAALVKTTRRSASYPPDISPGSPEWFYEMMLTDRMSEQTARAKLCEMGYCAAGALKAWKPKPRTSPTDPPDPDAGARARCSGVLADIAGRGKVCLDPTVPETREFRDCKDGVCGPVMVALPKGRYVRGTSEADLAALRRDFPEFTYEGKKEGPEREVTIDRVIAVSKFEVTFDDWDACISHFKCTRSGRPGDEGWGRGKRPVINVSWNDITREYLPWLNAKLGLSGTGAYRLLTDAEWEYAARAGTTTRYALGETITPADARFFAGPLGTPFGQTVETGSYKPNAFGLHDMHGNVAEWVEDCFSFMNDAGDLPVDGSARQEPDCSYRAYRGGGYRSAPIFVRSASRGTASADSRSSMAGLRLARTLGLKPGSTGHTYDPLR